MAEPLTAAELAAIKARVERAGPRATPWVTGTIEMTRLIATVEAYREFVAAVANGWSNALGTRVGASATEGLALKARAQALLKD